MRSTYYPGICTYVCTYVLTRYCTVNLVKANFKDLQNQFSPSEVLLIRI